MASDHAQHQHLRSILERLTNDVLLIADRHARMPVGLDAFAALSGGLVTSQTVMFCGAGISIPPPSHAPSFAEIRFAMIEACTVALLYRGALHSEHRNIIIDTARQFPRHPGLELPPEMIFWFAQDFLGEPAIIRLLSCLDMGQPNHNHRFLGRLVSGETPSLGVITTNFDTYIERSLGQEKVSVVLPHHPSVQMHSPILVKAHGSLDSPPSIVVTLERVAQRLDPSVFAALQRLMANREVVVVGYSGYDYDLLPVIVYAARSWGTSILWILFDESSYNDRIAAAELCIPDKLMLVNASRQSVFPMALNKPINDCRASVSTKNLSEYFQSVLESSSTSALLGLLSTMIGSIGLANLTDLRDEICDALFRSLRTDLSLGGESRVQLALCLIQFGRRHGRARKFLDLAMQTAMGVSDPRWLHYFEHMAGQLEASEAQQLLASVRFQLRERFSVGLPDREDLWPMLRLSLLTSRVEALYQNDDGPSAVAEGKRLLQNETFPQAPVPGQSLLTFDTKLEGKVHHTLAAALLEEGKEADAAMHLASAIEIFVRELSCIETIHAVANAARLRCRDCSRLAQELSKSIPRLAGLVWDELLNTAIEIVNGDGSKEDFDRVQYLLATYTFSEEERRLIDGWLSGVDRGAL